MNFDFPIRKTLRTSWGTYKTHWQFFFVLSLVTVLLNSISGLLENLHGMFYVYGTLCLVLFGIVWSFVWIKISLAVVRGEEAMLSFGSLRNMLPTGSQFLKLIGVGMLTGIIVLTGFVALIIPGVYFMTRLAFANLSLVDKNLTPGAAVKYSWHLVSGERFWTVLLVLLVSLVLIAIGAFTYGIALIVLYPIVMLLIAQLYKALDDFRIAQGPLEK